jgi:hypothetical protein
MAAGNGGMAVHTTVTATAHAVHAATPPDPTAGLTQYTDTYKIQSPYNLPPSARFSVADGVYTAFILKGDKGFTKGTKTAARTEMRWAANWKSGEHLWEADVNVDPGTAGTCIMQVKSDNGGDEPVYVMVRNNGNLYNSEDSTVLATHVWGEWIHLTVSYDPGSHTGHVWVNNNLVFTDHYVRKSSAVWYFKNGTYGITGARSEAHFKNIEFFSSAK